MENIKLEVSGMSCHHCEMRISKELLNAPGVKEVVASATDKSVVIKFDGDQIKIEKIKEIIAQTGYLVK